MNLVILLANVKTDFIIVVVFVKDLIPTNSFVHQNVPEYVRESVKRY